MLRAHSALKQGPSALSAPLSFSCIPFPKVNLRGGSLYSMAERNKEYDRRWNSIWEGGLEPGQAFDTTVTSPALLELIKEGKLQVRGKKVFVPGCGRGYDVVDFAKQGAVSVTGMELVPEAVPLYTAGDFFDISSPHAYDIGYDYTFFCAMDPAMRTRWAEAWADWLKPGGELVTLMFPVEEEGRQGPPWPVPQQLYEALLMAQGFTCVYLEQVAPEQCHKGREGKTWIGRWTYNLEAQK